MARTYFTITGGRTGTHWLSDFLTLNTKATCIHEPLGVYDFGVTMPDIRTLRIFNTFGNNQNVQAFWNRKFEVMRLMMEKQGLYAETNHTLAKCGLIENLAASEFSDEATIIILRRDLIKQCVSYLVRNDFFNITQVWQWFLDPSYPKKIINPRPFLDTGQLGQALWYCYEMAARQIYYKRKFGDRLNFVEIDLETVVKPEGAQAFWEMLGGQGDCILPPPANQNQNKPTPELVAEVERIVNAIVFEPEDLVDIALSEGFSFDEERELELA